MRDIGNNIRCIRMRLGITQEDLAERLFITRQAVSSYETGRTRPDVDMLIKIAEALNTDTNALLYGAPQVAYNQNAKKELLLGTAAALLLGIGYAGINYYLIYHVGHKIVLSIPQNLMRVTLLPAMWFLVGWTLLHGLLMLPGMPKIQLRHQKKYYFAGCIALGSITALQLPLIIYLAVAFYRSLALDSVSMSFPNIPVYTQIANWLLITTLRANSAYAVWGAIIRFLRPPVQQ